MVEISRIDWHVAALRAAVLFALLWFLPRMKRPLGIALLAAFVIADLVPVVNELNPRMPSRFFTDDPIALRRFPADRHAFRIFHEADWYGNESPANKYFATGDAVYWIVRNGLYPMTPVGHGLSMVMERDYDKTALIPTIELTNAVWSIKRSGRPDWWRPVMAMSNAWYRAEYKPFDEEKKRVKGRMKEAQPVTFAEVDHAPRYYFADQVVTIRNPDDFAKKLSKGSYSARVAFVEMASFVPAPGVVTEWRETPNTATIDVESEGKAFLVMSVTPHKYWRVTIDGSPTTAIVTNVGYQGVIVPEGGHRVEMRYRNPLVAGGAKVSIAATFLLLVGAFVPSRNRTRL
jgi:hypothetical protein